MDSNVAEKAGAVRLDTLPGDEIRRVLWRFADRTDLQAVVQAARDVARGPVARLVAGGERHSHEWTDAKASLLHEYDEAGLTALYLSPEHGGYVLGPKNLAMGLAAFELAWVDGGAGAVHLAGNLALAPIHEAGTAEQRERFMARCAPGRADRTWRGSFCMTEPLPHVGVEAGKLAGTVRVEKWEDGKEPILRVQKRGRFITNMAFANFVTAAVSADDERIAGSMMIVLEDGDPGTFDRGTPTRKMVHQLASTMDPTFDLLVPASRIVGGYTVQNGVIIPNRQLADVIGSTFRRTRVTVGLMSSAKLLSAIEPLIRYHRERFRGSAHPGTAHHELGLQQREDVQHRVIDIWATGEASASLGFAAARHMDAFDPLEMNKDDILLAEGVDGSLDETRYLRKASVKAIQYLRLRRIAEDDKDRRQLDALGRDPLVAYTIADAVADVLCPACKLWNTGHGANTMREALSLMGGSGITEDCPAFLTHKWMDAQLEATYEGPEAVQRRTLSVTMTNEVFLEQFRGWIRELRAISSRRPGTGACSLASTMELWLWTLQHLLHAKDDAGKPLYRGTRQGVTFPMADALCWILASRAQMLDVVELDERGADDPELAASLPGTVQFLTDLCHVHAARAAGEVARICSELVFGYREHPSWSDRGSCYTPDQLLQLESIMPGIVAGETGHGDVVEEDGSHPEKAGPCATFEGMEAFQRLRRKMDGCGTGARLAKDRAAMALTTVSIPEKLDYPR